MHTPEQAKELWCPMARVAQVGAIETSTAYNRTISKTHRTVKAAWATADSFELGTDAPEPKEINILSAEPGVSGASYCLADKCAMWRWGSFIAPPENAEPGKLCIGVEHRAGVGYCGLAGKPTN